MTTEIPQPRVRSTDTREPNVAFDDDDDGLQCNNDSMPKSTATPSADVVDMLVKRIDGNSIACDLLCSLFMAALHNYRCDTVLRPFPSEYVIPSESNEREIIKDFHKLVTKRLQKSVAEELPPITYDLFNRTEAATVPQSALQLLCWILDTKTFTLHSVSKTKLRFTEITKLTGQVVDTPSPTHVFEVIHSQTSDVRFQAKCSQNGVIYAYHGSRLENFHSILHNGLRNHMNKNSLFGQGTYLSCELSVCLPYSPTGQGWDKSMLGNGISCVAVCEVINHPDVKFHTRGGLSDSSNSRGRPESSLNGGIPEKYYLVQNDELARVKYILVYADRPAFSMSRRTNLEPRPRSWISRNRFVLMMLAYLLVLFAIGVGNSSSFHSVYRKFML